MPTPVLLLAALVAEGSPEGRWTNPKGSVTVAIAPCGGEWCGTVVWASDKARADAARAGTATLVGTQIMSGFRPSGDGRWRGRLFVPDKKVRSSAELRLLDPARLSVRGCMVGKVLCKSQTWTRAN